MANIWSDTMKPKGKYEQKRVMTFSGFFAGVIYAFIPIFIPEFDVKDFVFIAFLGLAGGSSFLSLKDKIVANQFESNQPIEQIQN